MPDPTLLDHPAVLWATAIVGVLIIVAAAAPKITGPLRESWESLILGARRTHAERDDADIGSLKRQVAILTGQVTGLRDDIAGLRHYQSAHDATLVQHRHWDLHVLEIAGRHGIALPAPPPLYPDAPTLSPPDDGQPDDITKAR